MKHPTKKQLAAYHNGGGTREFREAVAKHLSGCADCSRLLRPSDHKTSSRQKASSQSSPSRKNEIPTQLTNHKLYKVISKLGAGGMGMVFRVQHRLTGRDEVVKVISPSLVSKPEIRTRFLNEIQAAARLDHPNIVRTLTAFEEDNLLGLVMEYAPGKDLDALVRHRGALPFSEACKYIIDASMGLQYAMSRGTVHRDIKPANLLLVNHEGKRHVKILDFGLSKGVSELNQANATLTADGRILGTPDFMSPEQAVNASNADIRSDIYSLGCAFYTLLCGVPPFKESSAIATISAHLTKQMTPASECNVNVPKELDLIIARMTAKEPSLRYQTPAEVANAINAFLETTDSIAKLRHSLQRAGEKPQKQPPETHKFITTNCPSPPRSIPSTRRLKRKEKSSHAFVVNLLLTCLSLVLVGAGYYYFGEQITKFVRSQTVFTESHIVLKDLPLGVDVLVDDRPAQFSRPTAGALPQIVAEPGTYKLSVIQHGKLCFSQNVYVEEGRDVVVTVNVRSLARTGRSDAMAGSRTAAKADRSSKGVSQSQLNATQVAEMFANAKRLLLDRKWREASELLFPLSELQLVESPQVERLIRLGQSLEVFCSKLKESQSERKNGEAFYLGTPPGKAVIIEATSDSISIESGEGQATYLYENLPPEIEQALFGFADFSDPTVRQLAKAAGLLTHPSFHEAQQLFVHSDLSYGEISETADDLGIELMAESDVQTRNDLIGGSHDPSSLLKGSTGAVEGLYLFRRGYVFGDQPTLLANYANGVSQFRIWNLDTNEVLPSSILPGRLLDCAASSNGRLFVTLDSRIADRPSVQVYAPPVAKPIVSFSDIVGPIAQIQLSGDGRFLTRCGSDETILRTNLQTGKTLLKSKAENPATAAELTSLAISPDKSSVASALRDGSIRLWQIASGKEIARTQSNKPVFQLLFNRDGSLLIVVRSSGKMESYSAEDLSLVQELWAHNCPVTAVSKSMDDMFLISADLESNVRIWDRSDLTLASWLSEERGSTITSVSYDKYTKYAAVGFANSDVRLWKPKTTSTPQE